MGFQFHYMYYLRILVESKVGYKRMLVCNLHIYVNVLEYTIFHRYLLLFNESTWKSLGFGCETTFLFLHLLSCTSNNVKK